MLTTGVDTPAGATGNDTFVATGATLNAADTINGGLGNDTLSVTVDGAKTAGSGATLLAAADVKAVEVISVRNVQTAAAAADAALTVTGTNFVGATEFVNDRSTADVNFNNIGTADVTVQGNNVAVHTATNITAGAAAVTDAFVLNIKDGVKGGVVTVNDANAKWTDATINSTGAANTVGAVNLSGAAATDTTHTVKNLTINAASNLTTGNITGFDIGAGVTNTITVKGAAASVKIGTLAGAIDVVDASGLTAGGLTATLNASTAIKFTGGAGNDVVTSAGVLLATGAFVDAGAGTADRLVLTTAIAADTAGKASAALYKGFEELRLDGGITQDVSIFTGSTVGKLVLAAGGTVQNASAAQAANVQALASGAFDIGVKGAATVGQIDTVHITADDGVAGMAVGPIALGTPTLAGVEILQLTANDNVTITALTSAPALTNVTLAGAGTIGLTTGAINLAANSKIDGAAATGNLTIDASGAQAGPGTTGLAIVGGSGQDVISGTVKADAIIGGAGNDVISGDGAVTVGTAATATTIAAVSAGTAAHVAADVLTGGAGRDVFAFAPGAGNTVAVASTITDLDFGGATLALGVDQISFDGATGGAATIVTLTAAQQTAVTAAANLAAAVDAVSAATNGAVNNVAQFTFGADTYVYINGVLGGATYAAGEDLLVKITGVAGTIDASDFSIV